MENLSGWLTTIVARVSPNMLHDMFAMPFEEIAPIVDRSPEATLASDFGLDVTFRETGDAAVRMGAARMSADYATGPAAVAGIFSGRAVAARTALIDGSRAHRPARGDPAGLSPAREPVTQARARSRSVTFKGDVVKACGHAARV